MDTGLLASACGTRTRTGSPAVLAGCALLLLFLTSVHAQAQTTTMPQWASSLWWRGCASLDLDFYNDRYYINGNTTCDGTVGTVYTAGSGNTGVQNFITGTGATFTRGGTSNITASGIPFYLASNESFVSRGSAASYFNSSGVLSSASTNTARTNYAYNGNAWINEGTLIEPASTNLLLHSGTVGGTSWTLSNATAASGYSAPDGSTNASYVEQNASPSGSVYIGQPTTASISSGTPVTVSIYAKAATTGNELGLRFQGTYPSRVDALFNLSNGTIVATLATNYTGLSASITSVGSGWYLCVLTGTPNESRTMSLIAGPTSVTATNVGNWESYAYANQSDAYIWGAQLEQSSYPTSYIATAGSTAARSADVYSALGGSNDITSTASPFYLASNQYYFSRNSTATYFDSTGTLRYAPFWAGRTNYTYNGSSWVNSGTRSRRRRQI